MGAWLVLLLALVGSARAHIVVGEKSLQQHVAESRTVIIARVLDPAARYRSAEGRIERPVLEVEVEETLKGLATQSPLRIAQHGHGVATYRPGDRAIFFLDPIEAHRELRALEGPGAPTHVSTQEHDEAFVLGPPDGERMLGAVRAYVKVADATLDAATRTGLLRKATLDLLESRSGPLGASALSSLVASPSIELLRREDLPRLDALLVDAERPPGFRAGLLAELERRRLVEGEARWTRLLASSPREDLPATIRAVGPRAGDALESHLLRLLKDGDERIAAEAALALGRPGRVRAVPELAKAIGTGGPRLRGASIRALEAIGTTEARQALERIAAEHPDATTRRRAAAALGTHFREAKASSAR
ncbi:MAG TPA: HEAT repeat domain-containing protein [Myxococcota bacterium]|nr:HEAT repeat domain-containing protein [Myxococcota bacterium]